MNCLEHSTNHQDWRETLFLQRWPSNPILFYIMRKSPNIDIDRETINGSSYNYLQILIVSSFLEIVGLVRLYHSKVATESDRSAILHRGIN